MKELLLYLLMFIFIFLFYQIFVISRKSILNKFPEGKEMRYLKYKYGIKVKEKDIKKLANLVYLANSFIISTTVFVMTLFNNLLLEILIGLITLVLLILILYHFIGIFYKKRQGGK